MRHQTSIAKLLHKLLILGILLGPGVCASEDSPARVVSINLCTDQLLLMLADPAQIASVSYLARDPQHSFVAEQATGFPLNHARAEELIALKPDLVLAGTATSPRLLSLLQRLGIAVEQFPLTHTLAGIQRDIRRLAKRLGRAQKGRELITVMQTRIEAVQARLDRRHRPKALFYQPRGYTSGRNTLQDEALRLAGWRNLATELGIEGYSRIDLERLLLSQPDRLFTSSQATAGSSLAQRQLDHPALRHAFGEHGLQEIPYKYWICAGPMLADAIVTLSHAHVD